MKLSRFTISSAIAFYISAPVGVSAFSQSRPSVRSSISTSTITISTSNSPVYVATSNKNRSRTTSLPSTAVAASDSDTAAVASSVSLGYKEVNKLTFRELQRTCKERGLPAVGNTATLRSRILESLDISECAPGEEDVEEVSC